MSVRPAKTQISLGIRPVWSESSLSTQWVTKNPILSSCILLVLSCRGSFSDRCSSAARAEQDHYHSVYWWDEDLERSQASMREPGAEASRYHLLLDVRHCKQHGVSQSLAGSACRVRCDEALRGWGIILLFLTSCFTVSKNQKFNLVVSLI